MHELALILFGRQRVSTLQDRVSNLGVHNLSAFPLSQVHRQVLGMGLIYILAPSPMSRERFQEDVSRWTRSIRIRYCFRLESRLVPRFRVPNPTWEPPLASPPLERYIDTASRVLMSSFDGSTRRKRRTLSRPLFLALKELRNEPSIVIKPADKNLGLTVMDRGFYIDMCLAHLNDVNTYSLIDGGIPFPEIEARLKDILAFYPQVKSLDSNSRKFILEVPTNGWRACLFYCLPKLHKTPVVGRPICSATGFITNHASRWLDAELQPVVCSHPIHLKDSQTLLRQLERTKFAQSILLFQFDVVSLYPSIHIEHAMEKIAPLIRAWPSFDERHANCILDLLTWVLRNNYCEFQERVYLQLKGVAMGTPMAVVFSCLYMMCLERELALTQPLHPMFLRRFIDDGFGIWFGPRAQLEAWLNAYNTIFPGIRITHTISDQSIEILDIVFSKGVRFRKSGILDTTTHQKALNRYLYLPWRSFHPRHAKVAFIYGELRRYCMRESSVSGFLTLRQKFFDRLRARGYPVAFLRATFTKVAYSMRPSLLHGASRRSSRAGAPQVFKTEFNPRIANLNLGVILKTLRNFDDPKSYELTRTIIAWQRGRNLRNLLVRARCAPHAPDI